MLTDGFQPFDATTPFIERDNYAWCISCHTTRTSPKCRGCKKPVTELVVKALDADWHEDCFACVECGGSFEDGRFYVRRRTEEGKNGRTKEVEMPACGGCEERRLKSWNGAGGWI